MFVLPPREVVEAWLATAQYPIRPSKRHPDTRVQWVVPTFVRTVPVEVHGVAPAELRVQVIISVGPTREARWRTMDGDRKRKAREDVEAVLGPRGYAYAFEPAADVLLGMHKSVDLTNVSPSQWEALRVGLLDALEDIAEVAEICVRTFRLHI